MAEVIWGIDMNNSTTNYQPIKRYCRYTGKECELATDFGYCQITACIKRGVDECTTWRVDDEHTD